MLEKDSLYQIQPLSLNIMDYLTNKEIKIMQDEIVKILEVNGIKVLIKRLKTNEIFEVSKQGLDFAVEKFN